ncbi:DUF3653 domain-containing protein [Stenotrophomonas pavanii]|uniref:DUF3653 domain-containing protein n=1 Tax=Stenotrophomonas pavanii TaxID=487698 RepID=UPI000CD2274D|nr:DUF3653 domain-containing protein [Stenotrophomonas pavanii]PNY74370.1 hypothetical protein C1750_07390 [Stenotrophomonas pavanii]
MIEFDPHNGIDLTGPRAGFSFLGDHLITPEGRELLPEDLAWLSLTACQAQEWRRMMAQLRSAPIEKPSSTMDSAEVIDVTILIARRQQRLSRVLAGADADPVAAVLPVPGPRPRQRV